MMGHKLEGKVTFGKHWLSHYIQDAIERKYQQYSKVNTKQEYTSSVVFAWLHSVSFWYPGTIELGVVVVTTSGLKNEEVFEFRRGGVDEEETELRVTDWVNNAGAGAFANLPSGTDGCFNIFFIFNV